MPRRNRRIPDWLRRATGRIRGDRAGYLGTFSLTRDLRRLQAPGVHQDLAADNVHGARDGRDGTCLSGKVRYGTERAARLALASAVVSLNLGQTARAERRVYGDCPCGGFHLTSHAYRPRPTPSLAAGPVIPAPRDDTDGPVSGPVGTVTTTASTHPGRGPHA